MGDLRSSIGFRVALAATWVLLGFLLLPILVAVPVSLTPERYLSLPKDGISLRHYENLATNELWLSSIGQSVVIAIAATALAVTFGTLAAIGLWRVASRASEAVRILILLPIVVPPVVSALAIYNTWIDLRLIDSYLGVILAHTILAVPYVVITVSTSLANFDPRLEQAARNLGATLGQAVRRVILPAIKPGIFAGAVFAFIASWDELVVTLFITSRGVYTLPRRMWDGIREHVDPTIAAVATVLIVLTAAAIAANLLRRKEPA